MYIANILCVTRNPPKILIAAKAIAKKPNKLDELNTFCELPDNPAIIAGLSGNSDTVFNTSSIFGFLAIALAAINIFGGFLVTQRMLAMYKKKKKDK